MKDGAVVTDSLSTDGRYGNVCTEGLPEVASREQKRESPVQH